MRCSSCSRGFIWFLFFALVSKTFCSKYIILDALKSLGDSCFLEEETTGCGAGLVRNIRSTCSEKSEGLYQQLRWDAPLKGCREITGYRIYIDQPTTSRICFQVAHNRTWFTFDASLGYAGDDFKFAVTAQPIVRVGQVFTQTMFHSAACALMHSTSELSSHNTTNDIHDNKIHSTIEISSLNTTKDSHSTKIHSTSGESLGQFDHFVGASVTVSLVILLLLTARFVNQTLFIEKVIFIEVSEI